MTRSRLRHLCRPPSARRHLQACKHYSMILVSESKNPIPRYRYFNTTLCRWSRPIIQGDVLPPRLVHTPVWYEGKIWVFGGWNGVQALNDVWMLDLGMGERVMGGGGNGHGRRHGYGQGSQKETMKQPEIEIAMKGKPTSPSVIRWSLLVGVIEKTASQRYGSLSLVCVPFLWSRWEEVSLTFT
jgi:hypothetical protein